jgi:hypothetical protein
MNATNGNPDNGSSNKRRRNRKRRSKGKAVAEYWGDKDELPEPTSDIRITDEPLPL